MSRLSGAVIGAAAMYTWGGVNAATRPPAPFPPAWYATMAVLLTLALLSQFSQLRRAVVSADGRDATSVRGRLLVALAMALVVTLVGAAAAVLVELVAFPGTPWPRAAQQGLWHAGALAVIVSATVPVGSAVAGPRSDRGE